MRSLSKLENTYKFMQHQMFAVQLQLQKQTIEMTTAKITAWIFAFFGWPMLGISVLSDMDKTKATILFIVGLVFSSIGFYYRRKSWISNLVSKRLDNQLKALSIKKEELEQKQKALELEEKEQDLKQWHDLIDKQNKKKP